MTQIGVPGTDRPRPVVCLGESMAQVLPAGGERLVGATQFVVHHAGAESNVAISLARLGTRASWAGLVGEDPLGARIVREISDFGVETDLVRPVVGAQTGVFFKDPTPGGSTVYYYREGSAASTMGLGYVEVVLDSQPQWLHLSGVTCALSASCRSVVAALQQRAAEQAVPVSFDVNYRPVLWAGRDEAARVIAERANASDVVFVGLDEAFALWGCETADEVRATLPSPSVVIVKNGAVDATSFSVGEVTTVSALRVDVVEPVGAGDAFAAGWLHAHLAGLDAVSKLRLGHLMAGISLISATDFGVLPDGPEVLVARAVSGADWAVDGARRSPTG
ncbi:MAG: sugar kinase [Cellulomonas sp.]